MSGEWSFRDLAKGAPAQAELNSLLSPHDLYPSILSCILIKTPSTSCISLQLCIYVFQQNSIKVHGGT